MIRARESVALPDSYYDSWNDFPGDEVIAPGVYNQVMDSRYSIFAMGAIGAANSFGIELDNETAERWKRIAPAAGLLDNFIDHPKNISRDNALQLYKQGLDHVRGAAEEPLLPAGTDELLAPAVRLMNNAVAGVPEERKDLMLGAAERIGEISAQKTACTSVREYIRLLREEGGLSAVLMTQAASDEVYNQPGYRDFEIFFFGVMVSGTFADSAKDLHDDISDNLAGIENNLENRYAIGRSVLEYAPAIILPKNFRAIRAALASVKRYKPQLVESHT